jgi:glutathione peroxidase
MALLGVFVMTLALQAEDKKEPAKSEKAVPAVLNFKMKSLGGKEVDLSKYQGKVVLMVNVASKCGATPQYTPLQELHEKYKDQGLVVLGFPCNQFGAQEPGTATEIEEFCTENYGVTFDMFEKIDVNGEKAAPLYKYLTSKETNPDSPGKINWNFEKFLISRDGKIVSRFKTQISPDEPEVVKAIEAEIGKK